MASPSPREKWRYLLSLLRRAAVLRLQTWCLAVPLTPCFPQLPPRGQSAVTQSSFSVREAASPRSGMSKKNTLYRALHDGRPVNSWC